ncbi:MAG: hypothetical protein ACLRSY_04525 [Acutalibacter sp.]
MEVVIDEPVKPRHRALGICEGISSASTPTTVTQSATSRAAS